MGSATYRISYSAVGATVVWGEVNYYSPKGWKLEVFKDSTSITTGNAYAIVSVAFRGSPFGSAVNGTVFPPIQ